MKAAVLEALEQVELKEVPTPTAGDDGMVVRVRACSICGSDLRIYHHGNPRVEPPQIMGHEIAGDVVEIGPNVTGFAAGDRVSIGADVPCGVCEFCRAGHGNNCSINYAIGYQFPGGFAEYIGLNGTTMRYGPVHHIAGGVDYETAALAEPLACCVNGLELVSVGPGDSVVIIGAGPAGCLLAQLARQMGAVRVILAQRSRARLQIAERLGVATLICTAEENLRDSVMAETDGVGADVVVTACASPEAQAQSIDLARNRGRINFFGGLPKGTPPIQLDSNTIHYGELLVTGSHGCVPRHHRTALGLLASGAIDVKSLITHRLPLDDILEGFEIVENRTGMKVIVEP
jgi:L-iditol 2-dehydrogenase